MADEKKICVGCGATFYFGSNDQAFYKEQGYVPPKRCKKCRDDRKALKEGTVHAPTHSIEVKHAQKTFDDWEKFFNGIT